jgi:hypothetical protein
MTDPAPKRKLSEVLVKEFREIAGEANFTAAFNGATAEAEGRQQSPGVPAATPEQRILYATAYRLNLNALCLSGGGIRSAAISLGVIQALVNAKLLKQFQYLSTVSGGGYIGSWLSAWLHHTGNAHEVLRSLGSSRIDPDKESPPLDHLRGYSNYLTPKVGLFSADTWTAIAIVLRNIAINWLILVPGIALLVIGVKLLALFLTWTIELPGAGWSFGHRALIFLIALGCFLAGATAFGYKLGRLYVPPYSEMPREVVQSPAAVENPNEAEDIPPYTEMPHEVVQSPAAVEKPNKAQARFLVASLLPAMVGGFCFVWLAVQHTTPAIALIQAIFGQETTLDPPYPILLFALIVYILALVVAVWWRRRMGVTPPSSRFGLARDDFTCWAAAVLVFATLAGLLAYTIHCLQARLLIYGCDPGTAACATSNPSTVYIRRESLVAVFGVPAFLIATMFAHFIYLLLRSASSKGEVEREWLGRASGWHFIGAFAWITLSAVVLLGPAIYYNFSLTVKVLTAASGAVTAWLGKSGLTPATGGAIDWKGIAGNIALAVAGPLFAVLLLILLSVGIDWSVIGWDGKCFPTDGDWDCRTWDWLVPIVVLAVVLLAANYFANINAFSLHAIYRNRLIRCFLGAARAGDRHPEAFTDFDWDDDLRVADLWRKPLVEGDWRPFHVINMTLNLAATNRLAWQERKAMPFSVTPFSCGNPELGYRETKRYGGPPVPDGPRGEIRSGISLGTAMAISGAAVSSNMGYHSSMSLSFLLTFLNVRLGVWLANPGDAGERPPLHGFLGLRCPHETPGPQFALRPLISELFGLTDDDSPYVNLSDGGHFEDLGLYEMVRRRCRRIIVVDGDQDGARGFGDLGNAVRKIWIDLGVRITFDDADLLAAETDAKLAGIPYFAVGNIDYVSDPPVQDPKVKGKSTAPTGTILYIKPVVRGDEPAADVIAYKRAHRDFPAQSTAQQWFDESQFESYRRLGQLMTERIIEATEVAQDHLSLTTLFEGLHQIDGATMKKQEPLVNIC